MSVQGDGETAKRREKVEEEIERERGGETDDQQRYKDRGFASTDYRSHWVIEKRSRQAGEVGEDGKRRDEKFDQQRRGQ